MNRRGVVDDMVLWLGLIVMGGVAIILAYILLDGLNTGIQNADQFSADQKSFMSGYTSDFSSVWDYTFLTVFVSSIIALLVITYLLRSNPAMFFAVWFVVILLGIVGAALSNGIEFAFDSSDTMAAAGTNFPITLHILEHLVLYVIGGAFLMLLVFFAKPGGDF